MTIAQVIAENERLKLFKLWSSLKQEGFNTIPEVFDAQAPHRPNGCISQAWSVAEVIRAWALIKKKKI